MDSRLEQLENFKGIKKPVNKDLYTKIKNDETFEYTNNEMAKYLISTIKFKDNDIVIEPCKGGGAFYNNLPNNIIKKYCEIKENKDYLLFNEMVDVTLSNPPFVPRKLFWSFMLNAMKTTRREIYWLINMRSLEVFTKNRMEEIKKNEWYLQSMKILSDKRWRGRYVWCKFTKEPNDFFTCCNIGF